jgi:chromosomal replication initiation ATPase DnaA
MLVHSPHETPCPPTTARTDSFDAVLSIVSAEFGTARRLLLHPNRCMKQAALVRQIAMYLAHVVLGRTMSDVGMAFGRDRSTVAYACGKIEDLREDPAFDARLERLTIAIEARTERGGEALHG